MRFTIDTSDLERKLGGVAVSERRLRSNVGLALNRVAEAVRAEEIREMRDVFDRPTPYTLGSLYVSRVAIAMQSGRAEVGVKTNVGGSRSALSWLRWQIKGGLREQTAFERTLIRAGAMRDDQRMVPGRFARLDSFGNVSRGQLVQILSQLRIDTASGSTRKLTQYSFEDTASDRRAKAGKIRSAYRRAGGQYIAFPNGRGTLLAGIYQVRATAWGRTDPKPVLLFVSKASYEAERFDFFGVARSTIRRELPAALNGQLARMLLRMQPAGAAT